MSMRFRKSGTRLGKKNSSIVRFASASRRTMPNRAVLVQVARWTGLICGGYLLGTLGKLVGVPASHMVAGLVLGAVVALTGLSSDRLPRSAYQGVQALIGVMMGSYLDVAALRGSAADVLPLTAVTAATLVLSLGIAYWMSGRGRLDRPTATLSMVPGGASAITVVADDLDVDVRIVAVSQYLRLGLVALASPFVAMLLASAEAPEQHHRVASIFAGFTHVVNMPNQLTGVLTMLAIAILGTQFGRRVSLPASAVLGPMLLAAFVVSMGAAGGFAPKGVLEDLMFTLVGLEVGLRFTRSSLVRLRGLVPRLVFGSVLVAMGCAVLAGVLASLTGMPLIDAYLATTPGGIYLVMPVAVASHANIAVVSTVQSLRLFVAVLLAPPLVRWALSSGAPAEPSSPTTDDPVGDGNAPASPGKSTPPATEPATPIPATATRA